MTYDRAQVLGTFHCWLVPPLTVMPNLLNYLQLGADESVKGVTVGRQIEYHPQTWTGFIY